MFLSEKTTHAIFTTRTFQTFNKNHTTYICTKGKTLNVRQKEPLRKKDFFLSEVKAGIREAFLGVVLSETLFLNSIIYHQVVVKPFSPSMYIHLYTSCTFPSECFLKKSMPN